MGLDAIEIVMRVEKTFAIKIKDEEAEVLRTVGDMHQLVWSKIDGTVSDSCASQSIFYRLRSSMTETYDIDRMKVSPDILLPQLIPVNQTIAQWQNFSLNANLKLPDLEYRQPYNSIRYLLRINAIICTLFAVLIAIYYSTLLPLLLCPISYIVFVFFDKIFSNKKTAAPSVSMRQFASNVLALNIDNLKNVNGKSIYITRKEMEKIINNIIVDVLGVRVKDVTPEKSFVKDLGI